MTDTLTSLIRDFLDAHPRGWNHEEWLELLGNARDAGLSDEGAFGAALEGQRLRMSLVDARITGLGTKRISALVERYPTLWSLRCARPEDLVEIPSIHPRLAQSVIEEVTQLPL